MEPFWKSKWFWWSAVAVLGVFVFYLEQDVHGMLAWRKAKAEIEARGISLDPKAYIPPPVPDAENFGALPIFQLSPYPAGGYGVASGSIALNDALEPITTDMPNSKNDPLEPDSVPYLGNWAKGELPDVPAIQKRLLELCRKKFPGKTNSMTVKPVELVGLLCPVLADLRAQNNARPECRFDHDYASKSPYEISLSGTVSQLKVAKVLAYEERLALLSGEPALVVNDFKVAWKINSGLCKESIVISGLVALGVQAMQLAVLNEGLANHVWNDRQLADLDNDLGRIDDLTDLHFVVRGEAAFDHVQTLDYLKTHRVGVYNLWVPGGIPTLIDQVASWLIPNGWFDQLKADGARIHMLGTSQMVDPATRRVFPEREITADRIMTDNNETSYWHDFLRQMFSPTLSCVKKFAFEQARVDEARIACRLERYRLAHGQYPATLDPLIPDYGTDLPRDIMNGELYHYRLNKGGTYLLYSVAWNQTDDGGQTGTAGQYNTADSLDWIWTNYPYAQVKK